MAFQQRLRPYETLVRHNAPDAQNPSGSIGSQHRQIQEGYDDVTGHIYFANVLPPQPLDGAGLEAVIGQAVVQATAQIDAQAQQINALAQTLQARDTTIGQQADTIAQQAATIADLQAQIEVLTPKPAPEAPSAQEPAPEPEA